MATIYYPSNASVYTRQVNGGLVEQIIGLTPDTIFIFSTSSLGFTASLTTTGTSSWASSSISSSYTNFANVAISASWASSLCWLHGASTPSSFAISASWIESLSASWRRQLQVLFAISASWASQSLLASWCSQLVLRGIELFVGFVVPSISASWHRSLCRLCGAVN